MEFPHLGQHCNEKSCNKLDFLPLQCDGCHNIFCSTHFQYEQHKCISSKHKDYQVPLCPLCDEPIPTPPNVSPDITVGQHIDSQCKLETKKIFTNRCSYKNCKRKELIPVQCVQCKRNYCLRHRHTTDHECHGKVETQQQQQRTNAMNAAEWRLKQQFPSNITRNKMGAIPNTLAHNNNKRIDNNGITSLQGNMTEDEALARALALSIMDLDQSSHSQRSAQIDTNTNNLNTIPFVGPSSSNNTTNKNKCSLS